MQEASVGAVSIYRIGLHSSRAKSEAETRLELLNGDELNVIDSVVHVHAFHELVQGSVPTGSK